MYFRIWALVSGNCIRHYNTGQKRITEEITSAYHRKFYTSCMDRMDRNY